MNNKRWHWTPYEKKGAVENLRGCSLVSGVNDRAQNNQESKQSDYK